jgi:hypothetical protein
MKRATIKAEKFHRKRKGKYKGNIDVKMKK